MKRFIHTILAGLLLPVAALAIGKFCKASSPPT